MVSAGAANTDFVRPVFVGGTGRSGTTIVGALIASHPQYAGVPYEIRIHLNTALIAKGIRTPSWFQEEARKRHVSHLHRILEADELEALVETYLQKTRFADKRAAARQFIEGLMEPVQMVERKESWVEMTPSNAMWGSWLCEVFPTAALIHTLRDGRDVAVSVSKTWKTMSVDEALTWWKQRIELIWANYQQLAPESAHTIVFERFTVSDREAEYRRLLEFLGVDDHNAMRQFFDQNIGSAKANIGRWRKELSDADCAAIEERYETILDELGRHEIGWVANLTESLAS